MSKRILAFLCTAVLLVSMVPMVFAADGDKIYELTKAEVEEYIATGQGTDYLQNSGGGSTFASLEGANGVKFVGRSVEYDTLDIKTGDTEIFKAGTTYTVQLKVKRLTGDAPFQLLNTNGYKDLVDPIAAAEATITYTFKGGDVANIRIQTQKADSDFAVTSLVVYEGDKIPSGSTGGGNAGGNAKTGVESFLFIALGVLALAGIGAVVFTRKAKSM